MANIELKISVESDVDYASVARLLKHNLNRLYAESNLPPLFENIGAVNVSHADIKKAIELLELCGKNYKPEFDEPTGYVTT